MKRILVKAALALGCLGWGTAALAADTAALAERVVSKHTVTFSAPPQGVPSRDSARGPLLGNGSLGAVIGGPPQAQRFWLSKNNFWRLKDAHREGGPRLFGGLDIDIPALDGGSYLVEQHLHPAVTVSRFAAGGSTVTMRSLVAATADLLVVELTVAGAPVDVRTRIWAAPGRGSREDAGRTDGLAWAGKEFTTDVKMPSACAAALSVVGTEAVLPEKAAAAESPEAAQPGPAFTLRPGVAVTLAVAVQSSVDAREPVPAARALAAAVSAEKLAALRAEHAAWWRDFWGGSVVEIGDPLLEHRYYLSNYLLASSSRDTDFPPGLFGIWVTHDDPRWAGDYHLNYNYEAAFYGLYSSNHLAQARPYHAPVLAFMDRGRFYARKLLDKRGVYYPVGIGPLGTEPSRRGDLDNQAYQAGGCFMGQKSNAAYALTPISMHWYHTYDLDYAKTVYPFVLEVATFWEDYLTFEPATAGQGRFPAGRYVIENDSIQENSGPDFNSVMSLGLVRNVFETAVDMSHELGVDAGRREAWRTILARLSDFPTFERDGVVVFRETERGTEWSSSNTCGIQHIYPAGAIGPGSDQRLLEVSRNTIRLLNRWIDGNGMSSIYPAAVRVGYDPGLILGELRGMVEARGGTNGFTVGIAEGVENCSIVPNTINEMLCMGHGHVIRVFPGWPRERDSRFRDLRAWGAFLVSSELAGGEVRFVSIRSERGRDCTLANPWPGRTVEVRHQDAPPRRLSGEKIRFPTASGATYEIAPVER